MMKDSAKRRVSMRLLALCLGTSGALIAPSVALGADLGTGGTVRATIGDNGSVTSVKQVGANGATSAFSGQLPVKMTITHNGQTYSYHVENTFTKTQTVHFTDTAGNDRHTTVSLQLPLVAQLGVDVPKSMSNLSATGATVTTGANGVRHVLWNMVLFAPLGSSAQDVSFTAGGSGTPIAELRATPVDPSTTAGLSSKSQDKTAEFQQEDFWAGYASGGNGGLKQLADGTSKMVVGLGQLLSGLKTGVSGANQLADGSAKAHTGSVQLRDGLQKINAGLADTPAGLTGGLRLINGGLDQLADPTNGLQAAVVGVKQIRAGVEAMLAGVGDHTTQLTLLWGLSHPATSLTDPGGLREVLGELKSQAAPLALGLDCAVDVLNDIRTGTLTDSKAGTADPCYTSAANPAGLTPPIAAISDPTAGAILFSMTDPTSATSLAAAAAGVHSLSDDKGVYDQMIGGVDLLIGGLDNPAGVPGSTTNPPGVKQGLQLVDGGLQQLLSKTKGLPAAVAGVKALDAGSGKALSGSEQLLAGTGKAYSGSKDLASGLGQIATGNKQVADGLPPAVDGVQQLLDGSTQVHDGITQVQSGATGPLQTQLEQASRNAHQQIAVLNAASDLSSQAPGGAGTSYVLAQPGAIALAADTTSSGGSSHTGRNAALIAIGGVLALAIGLGAGIAVGRQRVSA
jgi:putative membrane protein